MEVTETNNQVDVTENVATETQEAERTFTQEEVNKMIESRVFKERSRYSDYEEIKAKAQKFDEMGGDNSEALTNANKRADELESQLNELKEANAVREIRDKVAAETGVPASLLTSATEEECRAQAEAIKAYASPSYPTVSDGGEPAQVNVGSTANQFADWFNNNRKH